MEIGGYMELEHFTLRPYHTDVYELNLGRTALTWLLEGLQCKTLFMPYFTCDSVTEACEKAGFHMEFYSLDQTLTPVLPRKLQDGEYLYLINYYGQLTDEKILSLKKQHSRVIVDHTHAFFQKPLEGVPTLYSCRKFFGVSDGAYLSCDLNLPLPEVTDESHTRFEHLLGRFERPASEFYSVMLDNAAHFHHEPIKQMSKLTRNILGAIDYDRVKRTRSDNYHYLKETLGHESMMTAVTPEGPFVYPLYVKRGIEIRKTLAAQKIFIPTYWNNVIQAMPQNTLEHDLAANILPLPCDQRYGEVHMQHLANAVQSVLKQYGE